MGSAHAVFAPPGVGTLRESIRRSLACASAVQPLDQPFRGEGGHCAASTHVGARGGGGALSLPAKRPQGLVWDWRRSDSRALRASWPVSSGCDPRNASHPAPPPPPPPHTQITREKEKLVKSPKRPQASPPATYPPPMWGQCNTGPKGCWGSKCNASAVRGRRPGMHWSGGRYPPSRAPSLCPATVPLTPDAGFLGICNRQ